MIMVYIILTSILITATSAFAQNDLDTLKLVETNHPQSWHEDKVDTVSFTFNMPIDTSVHYRKYGPLDFWQILPIDSVAIDSIFASDDLKTINYLIRHKTKSDFSWILENARSKEQHYLQKPHHLFYSFKPDSLSRYNIFGEATAITFTKVKNYTPNESISGYRHDTLRGPALKYNYVLVVLIKDVPPGYKDPFQPATSKYVYTEFLSYAVFNYVIENVTKGNYYPVLLARGKSKDSVNETSYYGFYDPDMNDEPDSIVVTNKDLYEVDVSGKRTSISDMPEVVRGYKLFSYPNPFNPQTTIRFHLQTSETVTLSVYNSIGHRVATLVDQKRNGGWHEVTFNGENLSSGVYIYRLETSSKTISKKMILLK